MPSETIILDGHIVDSLLLPKVLDLIDTGNGSHVIEQIAIGRTRREPSTATIRIDAPDDATLYKILAAVRQHGAIAAPRREATTAPAPQDGVAPPDFHAVSPGPLAVLIGEKWLPVEQAETLSCIVIANGAARMVPVGSVQEGDLVVVGRDGIRGG